MPGYFAFVLHAHLPFVRHPEHERFLEENWLFEAIAETYIPLLEMLGAWERDGVLGVSGAFVPAADPTGKPLAAARVTFAP
jgi:predicted glycosyl hydrolase (DUF1957 family)